MQKYKTLHLNIFHKLSINIRKMKNKNREDKHQ